MNAIPSLYSRVGHDDLFLQRELLCMPGTLGSFATS